MQSILRAFGIITVAAAISIAILAVLISATNTITEIQSVPADFLPEYHTVALFSKVDEETIRKFEAFFPVLGTITPNQKKTIALLAIEEELFVAEFLESDEDSTEETTFGRFSVSVSDPLAEALLKTSTPRLSSSLSYNQLVQEESWVFLDLSVLPFSKTFPEKILNALIPIGSTHAALSFEDGRTQISFVGSTPLPIRGLSPTIESTFSGSALTLRSYNASHTWTKLTHALADTERSFLEGSVSRIVEETFGSSVSFTYDILPMFTSPTTIHLGKNSSGVTLLAVEGIDKNSRTLSEHIELLHDGFRSVSPSTQVTKRTFDDRFSATDIRIDKSSTQKETDKYLNWEIITTRTSDRREFASAMRGSTFVMANSLSALEQILEKNVEVIPPSNPSLTVLEKITDGSVSLEDASSLIKEVFPSLKSESLPPFFNHLSGKLLWSVEQQGAVTTLIIE
ncbi:hypothetical protein KKF55_04865 [Patescibacteria group bacterium]|nr:hypothetical protein [Patescibacteria group bacterium]